MSIVQELDFDLFVVGAKENTQQGIFKILAEEASAVCGAHPETLLRVCGKRLNEATCGIGNGVAVFDVMSSHIKVPALAVMTFEDVVDFDSPDGEDVDIMAAVLSPQSCVPSHLQRLAGVSRVLRSDDLCVALRDVRNVDAMRVLFMPTQDWMVAA